MFRSPLMSLSRIMRGSLCPSYNVCAANIPRFPPFIRAFSTENLNRLSELQVSVAKSEVELGAESPKMTKIYYELAEEYKKASKFHEALKYFSKSYDLARRALGQNALILSKICFHIAECKSQMQDYQGAVEKYREAIEIEKANGRESGEVSMILHYDLGVAYILIQDLNSGLAVLQETLPALNSRKPDWITARIYSKLSFLHRTFKNLQEASKYARQAFEIIKASDFQNPIVKAEVKAELGIVSFLEDRFEESARLLKEAIQERSAIFQPNDIETAHLTLFLGNALSATGKLEESIEVFKEALDSLQNASYKDEQLLQEVYYHLGRAQFFTNAIQEAFENTNKSLEIVKKLNKTQTEQEALCYDSLIDIYSNLGEHDKYIENCEKALQIRRQLYGETDPRTGKSYITAGMSDLCCDPVKCCGYLEKGIRILRPHINNLIYFDSLTAGLSTLSMVTKRENPSGAEQLMLDCIEIKEKVLGKDPHPSIADSLYGLASIYQTTGEHEKAVTVADRAYQTALATLGDTHFLTLEILDLKGILLGNLSHFEEALKVQEECLRLKEENFGDDPSVIAPAYQLVGFTYYAIGDFQNALKYYKKGTDLYEQVTESIDMELVQSWAKLSEIYRAMGDYQNEKEYLQRVYDCFREVEGEEGENTKAVKERMNRRI
jgi:tetratricopeptide (TPR) repeat protein